MSLTIYNSLGRTKQPFVPLQDKKVKMYVCGVTPYSSTHVGHALSYVIFDVLRSYLEHIGYQVQHVQNFTAVLHSWDHHDVILEQTTIFCICVSCSPTDLPVAVILFNRSVIGKNR